MPRTILTPEEREARRKARSQHSFSDAAYKHRYDPTAEGYGSAEEWASQADALARGMGLTLDTLRPKTKASPDLEALFLDAMPDDLAGLKRAFRNAMFVAHPDHGGSDEHAKAVLAAYQRLLRVFQ